MPLLTVPYKGVPYKTYWVYVLYPAPTDAAAVNVLSPAAAVFLPSLGFAHLPGRRRRCLPRGEKEARGRQGELNGR